MEIVIETPQIQDPKRHVKRRPKLKKPNLFAVILVNDNFTTMEFVIYIHKTIFDKRMCCRKEDELKLKSLSDLLGFSIQRVSVIEKDIKEQFKNYFSIEKNKTEGIK